MPPVYGSASRPSGGSRTRFVGATHHADIEQASLKATHPAVLEGRTLFPTRVKAIAEVDRVLCSGIHNSKIGATIERGPWAGMPVLTLTLEERKACPPTCELWRACYGNAMPASRRHAHGPELVARLDRELRYHTRAGAAVAVRLHVLGDFYSLAYVEAWARWMRDLPSLHVWGYTHWWSDTNTGRAIAALNAQWPNRWVIRFSVRPDAEFEPFQNTTIWRQPEGPRVEEGLVCPQQFEKTATCGTCGLCWSPRSVADRIVFVGHGMSATPKRAKQSAA